MQQLQNSKMDPQQRKIFAPLIVTQSQPSSALSAQCHFHPTFTITNFDKQSLMPLCPKCISTHLQQQKQRGEVHEIESIDQVHIETVSTIQKQYQNLQNAIDSLSRFSEAKHDSHGSLVDQVAMARMKVQRVVDSFFEQILSQLRQVTQQTKSEMDEEVGQAQSFMRKKLLEVESLEEKLQGKNFIKYLVGIMGTSVIKENDTYINECHSYIEEIKKKTLEVLCVDDVLYSLNIALAKFVQIKNASYYLDKNKQNQGDQSNPYLDNKISYGLESKLQSQGLHIDMQKAKVSTIQAPDQNPYMSKNYYNDPNKSQINEAQLPQLSINIPDYYDTQAQNKFIHYFKEGTRQLCLFALDSLQWKQIETNMLIPNAHTSLRSAAGQIYLLGGILNNQILCQAWRFDMSTKQFQQINENMLQPRHSGSSLCLNNKIYLFGGLNKNDIAVGESFDLQYDNTLTKGQAKKFVALRAQKLASKGVSLCSFRKRYILCVSQKGSEFYDTQTDVWTDVQANCSYRCGLVQVTNNSILIFGGSLNQYGVLRIQDNTNQLQLEQLEDKQNVGKKLQNILEGTLVHQNRIYAVDENQRKIIIGSQEQWII